MPPSPRPPVANALIRVRPPAASRDHMTTLFPEAALVAVKTAPTDDVAADAGTCACAG